MDKREYLISQLNTTGLSFSDRQIDQFLLFYELLIEKNKVMNLTAITEFEDVVEKHFLDSLSLYRVLDPKDLARFSLIDLGTGAGFPGIPLKIAFPELKITLADSLNKRILFLQQVITELGLLDITALHGRAEELGRNKDHREKYDVCLSRAVANLSTLSEYCLPLVKVGGCFVSYKAKTAREEAESAKNAIELLGGSLKLIEHFEMESGERNLIVIDKVRATKKAYPRKAGTPSKEPL